MLFGVAAHHCNLRSTCGGVTRKAGDSHRPLRPVSSRLLKRASASPFRRTERRRLLRCSRTTSSLAASWRRRLRQSASRVYGCWPSDGARTARRPLATSRARPRWAGHRRYRRAGGPHLLPLWPVARGFPTSDRRFGELEGGFPAQARPSTLDRLVTPSSKATIFFAGYIEYMRAAYMLCWRSRIMRREAK